jgi:putative oxidoreductase
MSDATATRQAPSARWTGAALWVLQAVLAFQFAGGGLLKLTGAPELVELFATIGAGQWLRYLVGTLEVAGAVGLLVPRLSGLAALGLACLMLGATATNLVVLGESAWLPIGLLLASAVVAWGRRSRTRALVARHGSGAPPPTTPAPGRAGR